MQREIIYEDRTRRCHDRGESFVWSSGEQRYFKSRLLKPPRVCPLCRPSTRREAVQSG